MPDLFNSQIATADDLKAKITAHFAKTGFDPYGGKLDKAEVKRLYTWQRQEMLAARQPIIAKWPFYRERFANGSDIESAKIKPRLEIVENGTWQLELFRLAACTWIVPPSDGIMRRLKFLVWDDNNGKLMGQFGINDAQYAIQCRDQWIGWAYDQKKCGMDSIWDGFHIGAVPPYNQLLGGKLVTCLIRTREVYDAVLAKYKEPLLLAMTTSALGRSSIYNRLKLGGRQYFKSVGFTKGHGHFHLPKDLIKELSEWARLQGVDTSKLRKMMTLHTVGKRLGLDYPLGRHRVAREVFVCPMTNNALDILRTGKGKPDLDGLLTVAEVGKLGVDRWMLPRSERRDAWRDWTVEQTREAMNGKGPPNGDPLRSEKVG